MLAEENLPNSVTMQENLHTFHDQSQLQLREFQHQEPFNNEFYIPHPFFLLQGSTYAQYHFPIMS